VHRCLVWPGAESWGECQPVAQTGLVARTVNESMAG
jgi:hypothetical protein